MLSVQRKQSGWRVVAITPIKRVSQKPGFRRIRGRKSFIFNTLFLENQLLRHPLKGRVLGSVGVINLYPDVYDDMNQYTDLTKPSTLQPLCRTSSTTGSSLDMSAILQPHQFFRGANGGSLKPKRRFITRKWRRTWAFAM